MPVHHELSSSPSAGDAHQLALWASPEDVAHADASLATAEAPPPWVIFHVPHDSTLIPPEIRNQFVLTDAELADELVKMTDHLTLALFTPGVPGQQVIQALVSRLVVDVERFEDDRQESMARQGMGAVYLKTSSGQTLRHPLPAHARGALIETWYRPHHARLTAATQRCLDTFGQALLIDAHSFPSTPLPYEKADTQLQRPDICIGTDRFHTPKALEEAFVKAFQAGGFNVAVNSPFAGALVPARYHRQDARVSAVMVEVNRSLYLDEATGQCASGFAQMSGRIRRCISAAIKAWACAGAAESPRVPPAAPASVNPAPPSEIFLLPESVIAPALIQAYLSARYRVDAQPPFTLKVGVFSEALARHFQRLPCDSAAYLTACNPLGEDVGDARNAARQAALARDLESCGLRFIDGMGLDGQDEEPQQWAGEASFLVFGLSLEASRALGRKYAQNALIWCGEDAVPQLILLR